jgi:hypothetical protein
MIFWISDINALTGPIPSKLGLLKELTFLLLSKSFFPFYFIKLCYELTLVCLDDLLDFRDKILDRFDTFRAGIPHRVDSALVG